MELLQTLLAAFGGIVAVLGVAAVLGKALLSHLLTREMEVLRSRLKTEGDTLLESFKDNLHKEVRLDNRAFELAQVMRRYQGPLMHAVYDLQSRLYNVLARRFFEVYLVGGSPNQKHYAEHNTAFLIAQFFGWTEIIRQEVQFIEFTETDKTRRLSAIRDEIYGLWQTDAFADPLMIWAGEQRAIGELMIEVRGDQLTCKGYANFLKTLSDANEPLMERLKEAVLTSATSHKGTHDRLLAVQHKLIDMLDVLDPDGLRFPSERRQKVRSDDFRG